MNTFESSASSPTGSRNPGEGREIGSSSSRLPTHANSELSSSAGSSRSHSSFSSRKNTRNQRDQQQPSNESTPIFNGAGASTRNYQSTEAPAASYGANGSARDGSTNSPNQTNGANGANGVNPQSRQSQSPAEPRQSRYSRFVQRYGSLELENKGSVARDHLALERTFLAWMRTSLAFASIGIAVTQLFRLNATTATAHTDSLDTPPAILPPLLSPSLLDTFSTTSSQDSTRLRSVGKPLGSTFIGVAILILVVGFHRYFESQYWIVRGKFPASRGSVALTASVALALIVAALAVILAVSPGAVER